MQLRFIARHAARVLPASVIAFLRKQRRQRAAKQRRQFRDACIAKNGCFDATELVTTLRGLGIAPGGVIFVQSSFNDMHTFSGRPVDLLNALRALVGPTGTLLMPAYTTDKPATQAAPLDIANLPTYTGIINELFRRSPGVLRSLHPRHSICAEGPLAATLLAEHENCLFADGPGSPFDRLRRRDDSLILTIGLAPGFTSFLHWIEDHEPDKLPLKVHETAAKKYHVLFPNGRTLMVSDMQVRTEVAARLDLQPVAKQLTPDVFRSISHRGIKFGLYFVKPFSDKLIALRDKGIFHYH